MASWTYRKRRRDKMLREMAKHNMILARKAEQSAQGRGEGNMKSEIRATAADSGRKQEG